VPALGEQGSGAIRPVFIFSLPRAGSTLLQRILAAHSQVATTAEPWILLPLLYSLRDRGIKAEYGQAWMVRALRDFVAELPGGEEEYRSELGRLALRLYSQAAGEEAAYFVDKTPSYDRVAGEIIELFPDGRFIFLWRNPLAVVASMMESWGGGRWNLNAYRSHLFEGLDGLLDAYQRHGDRSHCLRYEDLVVDPEAALLALSEYLGLPYEPAILSGFADVTLPGHLGDSAGVRRYRAVSAEPLGKWKQTLRNPFRQAWCRGYLRRIGEHRLAMMGYDLHGLLAELGEASGGARLVLSDAVRHGYGWAYSTIRARVLGGNFRRLDA
jgi:hypothetical protein